MNLKRVAQEPSGPTAERVAAGLLLDAVLGEGGHVRARTYDQVMNRLEGRPCQAVQITGPESEATAMTARPPSQVPSGGTMARDEKVGSSDKKLPTMLSS